ncbi:endonuclease/exonuclease/phosphatase family protein [Aquimonas voraii]|uniref:Endonuclease/Exonuclease/phosphatase family protein n=1 Tax=Aquimonas voraii TaxID=265719 RepID=A0A1G6SP30_9GAMM|nr:endonuclease/exonuclease/phosphatase family protein [Aquimonas voraii]SDD18660.1 Endonuclease/Exonuclease/phosphatase family protein [Aquimonas voraii]
MHALLKTGALLLGLAAAVAAPAAEEAPAVNIRVATYNLALTDDQPGAVIDRLRGDDAQARKLAAVIQSVRPDILLLNEIDRDEAGEAARLFRERYLGVGQSGLAPLDYPYSFHAPVNTGVPSGLDLDQNGQLGDPGDAWGFGRHPGQYGMLVLSRYPIDVEAARTFQHLRWADLPGALQPRLPDADTPWYPAEVWAQLRLSSKSHWDLPIDTPLGRLHLLAAHPTPPAFDGPERRNKLRNHDELKLWRDYLDGADWMVDDQGRRGPLAADAHFVIVGDLNADPVEGDSLPGAIQGLLEHPRVQAKPAPRSEGSFEAAQPGQGQESAQRGDPNTETAQFSPRRGTMRVDYVLPSRGFKVLDAGVFWPKRGEPGSDWVTASDHRMVWVDLSRE